MSCKPPDTPSSDAPDAEAEAQPDTGSIAAPEITVNAGPDSATAFTEP